MNFFNRILVPIDFSSISKAGIDKAIEIAVKCESSELHFLFVVDKNKIGQFVNTGSIGFIDTNLLDTITKDANIKLSEILDLYNELEHLHVRGEVIHGELAERSIAYVAANKIELVVMGNSGVAGIREFLFGSNTQRIASKVSCPVLALQPFNYIESIKKIIVPLEEFYPINKFHFAAILARLFSAEIHLVCLKENLHSETKKILPVLFQIIEKLDLLAIRYKIYASSFSKNFTDAILCYSEKEQIDLILVNPGEEAKFIGKIV